MRINPSDTAESFLRALMLEIAEAQGPVQIGVGMTDGDERSMAVLVVDLAGIVPAEAYDAAVEAFDEADHDVNVH